ncbi:MAG: glycosyltransferase family 4 protein [Alphaproteobacteria bacterium]
MTESALHEERVDILLFISDLGSGGAQRVLCRLAEHWSGAGRRVAVATLSSPDQDFFTLPADVQRRAINLNARSRSPVGGLLRNVARIRHLRRVLRELRPAVAVAFVGPNAVLLVAAAMGTGIHTVAAERNDPARQSFGRMWDRLRRWAYRRADRVTINSTGAANALRSIVQPDRLIYTPNPMPHPIDGATADIPGPCILAVARLHPQKGLDLLLNAFAALERPAWNLVIVGEGNERARLSAQADTLGISGRVRFTGTVSNPADYFRAADIFALPSRHEGTPNALMEAMSYGMAAIVSDASPGPLDLITNGTNGLVTPAGDVAALTRALQRLIDDRDLRETLGNAARTSMQARRYNDDAFTRWDAAVDFTSALSDNPA